MHSTSHIPGAQRDRGSFPRNVSVLPAKRQSHHQQQPTRANQDCQHPLVGELHLNREMQIRVAASNLTIVVCTPAPAPRTTDKPRTLLASTAAPTGATEQNSRGDPTVQRTHKRQAIYSRIEPWLNGLVDWFDSVQHLRRRPKSTVSGVAGPGPGGHERLERRHPTTMVGRAFSRSPTPSLRRCYVPDE